MNFIDFLAKYWFLLVAAIAILAIVVYAIKVFWQLPKEEKLAKVQEWLLYAVAQAEREFGSGTGQLKLRYVYDNFVARFPAIADKISFAAFSLLVDAALEKFNNMLTSNIKVQNYVNKEE